VVIGFRSFGSVQGQSLRFRSTSPHSHREYVTNSKSENVYKHIVLHGSCEEVRVLIFREFRLHTELKRRMCPPSHRLTPRSNVESVRRICPLSYP
jgi:hypothetical protein